VPLFAVYFHGRLYKMKVSYPLHDRSVPLKQLLSSDGSSRSLMAADRVNRPKGNGAELRTATCGRRAPSIAFWLLSLFAAVAAGMFPQSLVAATSITIGETTKLGITDSGNAGLILAQSVTLNQAAQLQSLSF
jgi:hypothetical protein